MYCWIKKIEQKSSATSHAGMSALRESLRKQILQNMFRQIYLYLFSFWFTWMFGAIQFANKLATGNPTYNLNIFANCVIASQGSIFMMVYFTLQKMGRPKVESLVQPAESSRPGFNRQLTVPEIRATAKRKEKNVGVEYVPGRRRESLNFNIFDGAPDNDSPWAMFIDPDSDDEEDAGEIINSPPEDEVHEQYDQQVSETKRTSRSSNGF